MFKRVSQAVDDVREASNAAKGMLIALVVCAFASLLAALSMLMVVTSHAS